MSQETSIPKLFQVSKEAVKAAKAVLVSELLELFQGDAELLTVTIADGEAFLGSISRKEHPGARGAG